MSKEIYEIMNQERKVARIDEMGGSMKQETVSEAILSDYISYTS